MAICLLSHEQIRDYIHVMDLADGHLAALRKLFDSEDSGLSLSLSLSIYLLKEKQWLPIFYKKKLQVVNEYITSEKKKPRQTPFPSFVHLP